MLKNVIKSFQKKQNLEDQFIKFNNISCSGKNIVDENSTLKNSQMTFRKEKKYQLTKSEMVQVKKRLFLLGMKELFLQQE